MLFRIDKITGAPGLGIFTSSLVVPSNSLLQILRSPDSRADTDRSRGGPHLGVTRDTLAAIRRKRGISCRRITKSKVLYHVDDIFEYLEHGKVKAGFLSD